MLRKKKNAKRTKPSEKLFVQLKKISVLPAICSSILFILMIIAACNEKYFKIINLLFNMFQAGETTFLKILTIILAILSFFSAIISIKKVVEIKQISFNDFVILFLVAVLFLVWCFSPMIVASAGAACMDFLEEKYDQNSTQSEQTDLSNKEENQNIASEEIEEVFKLVINFEDVFFLELSEDELEQYYDEIVDALIQEINKKLEIDKSLYNEYSDLVDSVKQFEDTYIYINNNDYFINKDKYRRLEYILESINIRMEANSLFISSENQRLIGIRYIDRAVEDIADNKPYEAINSYKQAIIWELKAIQTSYSEGNNDKKRIVTMLDSITECYDELSKSGDLNDEDINKAKILSKIYNDVRKNIKNN